MVQAPEREIATERSHGTVAGEQPELLREPVEEAPAEAPAPKRRRWLLAVAGLVLLGLVGAAIVVLSRGGAEPGPEIQTASGTFEITDVVSTDRYPEGCAEGPSCNVAVEGYKILLVKLAPQGGADADVIMSEGSDAYVVSADGDRSENWLTSTNFEDEQAVEGIVGFVPEESDTSFTLYWPDNAPVKLDR